MVYTKEQQVEILQLYNQGYPCFSIAQRFGKSSQSIAALLGKLNVIKKENKKQYIQPKNYKDILATKGLELFVARSDWYPGCVMVKKIKTKDDDMAFIRSKIKK